MAQLSESELIAVEDALSSRRGDALRQATFEANLGRPVSSANGMAYASELGWVDDDGGLTDLGRLVRDPVREYSLWLERGCALPSSDIVPALRRENYAGKRVLELGSGSGCNLLSLQGLDGRFVGVEPVHATLQMMPILARLAGLTVPEAVSGVAEDIPFDDNSFDIVVSYSSHQYMDVNVALREIARVLDVDGRVIIVGNSLGMFVPETITRFLKARRLGTLKYDTQAIVNTVSYQILGRRILRSGNGDPTGMPIYPSSRYMRRQLEAVGFIRNDALTCRLPSRETALFADATARDLEDCSAPC